ncbi:hypothetical protein MEX01_48840 [Methylorubrum extorquens]|uniref:DUF6065 family protein n=1 Tax=Methylorubrum extorquens TaxID=408 RepID=UPI00116C91E5|nr:DUF6065 family protein [Methylorubrum extorquens]GEL44293.1 hypothetical protein MEX01_48840 [Methylorubrum extorquens]
MARHGAVRPRIRSFDDDPELKAACEEWRSRRSAFHVRVAAGEPDAVRAGWQRDHIAECDPADRDGPTFHRIKRILPKPVRSAPVGADVALWNIAASIAPPRLKTGPRAAAAFVAHMPGT